MYNTTCFVSGFHAFFPLPGIKRLRWFLPRILPISFLGFFPVTFSFPRRLCGPLAGLERRQGSFFKQTGKPPRFSLTTSSFLFLLLPPRVPWRNGVPIVQTSPLRSDLPHRLPFYIWVLFKDRTPKKHLLECPFY